MGQPTADAVITAWERGRASRPLDRALVLHALAAPDADVSTLVDRPLGERNARLLELRSTLFGDALDACVRCPACDEQLEFSLSARHVGGPRRDVARAVEVDGRRFRMPTARDLEHAAGAADAGSAERALVLTLCEEPGGAPEAAVLALAGKVAEALDAADPCLDITVGLACESCGHTFSVPFDVAAYLWEELEVHARRLLDEVHALARAHGWSEAEILALSDARRDAYLQRLFA